MYTLYDGVLFQTSNESKKKKKIDCVLSLAIVPKTNLM